MGCWGAERKGLFIAQIRELFLSSPNVVVIVLKIEIEVLVQFVHKPLAAVLYWVMIFFSREFGDSKAGLS